MAVFPSSNTLVTSPTCHFVAAQVPNALCREQNSTSKVDCLANSDTASSSNTISLTQYTSVASFDSNNDSKSRISSISSRSGYPHSTSSPIIQSIGEDMIDFAIRPPPLHVHQMPKMEMCLAEPTGRSKRIRKLTSKALELQHDNTSRYYISSNTFGSPQQDQISTKKPLISGVRTLSTEPVAEGQRKRSITVKGSLTPTSVKRFKQDPRSPPGECPTREIQPSPEPCVRMDESDDCDVLKDVTDISQPPNPNEVKPTEENQNFIRRHEVQKEAGSPVEVRGKSFDATPTRRRSTRTMKIVGNNVPIPNATNKVGRAATPTKDTVAEEETHAVNKTSAAILSSQKEQECNEQVLTQASVNDNISFITIRIPSTQLRQITPSNPSSQESKPRPSTSSPQHYKKDAKLTGTPMKFEPSDLKCQLSCLKSKDPSLLLFILSKAIAQMDDEGAVDEDDEEFDVDDFQRCMKQQCLCDGKQPPNKLRSRVRLRIRSAPGSACTAKHPVNVGEDGN